MSMSVPNNVRPVRTNIPNRMDRLPWSRWHWLVVIALGITWILDGLEVTIIGAIASVLKDPQTVHFTDAEIGYAATAYLIGAVLGSLFFGRLTDKWGRKKLFMITLGVYLIATIATAFSFNIYWFIIFRFFTGAGIGGEYAAINSAIDELIPARARGWTDLAINGTFWIGAALGAGSSLVVLDPGLLPPWLGWRLAFGIGGALGFGVVVLRRFVPESPRWLMTHGRIAEAEAVVGEIETRVAAGTGEALPPVAGGISLVGATHVSLAVVARTLLRAYPARTLLGLVLMASQAFFYNAIFFTYALVLTRFYHVPADHVGWYILPFAVGNFCGPLLLGPLFDTIGRKTMIAATYAVSGLLLAVSGALFAEGLLDATLLTLCWTVVFFFASAAASAAYLTVGESFPLGLRALAIALFYAFGTLFGGAGSPWLFGVLIESGSRQEILVGYLLGAALMIIAALVELKLG